MKANGGYLIYMEHEVKKLIQAFQEKYNDPGCDGLPYEPNGIWVKFLVRAPKKHQPKKSASELTERK